MKSGASKIGGLLLACVALAVVAFALHQALKPRPTVEVLVQSVKRDASYRELERALESDDPKQRLTAVQALLELQTDEAFRLLEKATGDRSTVVRVAIVQRLQTLPEQRALPIILNLLDDREFGITRDAITALQRLNTNNYDFRFEAPPNERLAVITQCKRDIRERLKQ
jgi:hypothetical protein